MTQFVPDPGWREFAATPSKPAFTPPAGAIDAHCHVFGPADTFPYSPDRSYTPTDATKYDLFERRDFLGFHKNVIVQAACHGTDNRAMIDAVRSANGRARGIAIVAADVTDDELQAMHEAGIRGVRFSFVKRLASPKPDAYYIAISERIAELGWHVVLYFESTDLAERYELFSSFPVPVVVDHLGRPDLSSGPDGPEFERLRRLMRNKKNLYMKVTCPDRLSLEGPPDYSDALPFARIIVAEFPERVLWGTDWPHPNMKSHMPDDGHIVDTIPKIAPTTEEQHALLVENPERLYWSEDS